MIQRTRFETHEKYLVWGIVAYRAMLRLPISERGKIDRDSEKILNQRMSFERMDDKFLRGAIKLLVDDLNQTRYHLKHFPAKDTSCQQCIRTSDP